MEVGNGDCIAFDLSLGEDPPVVYLSHDDGQGHGYVMGRNFMELIDHWSRIGFVGSEDWVWLPFVAGKLSGLDPECGAAQQWREILNLRI